MWQASSILGYDPYERTSGKHWYVWPDWSILACSGLAIRIPLWIENHTHIYVILLQICIFVYILDLGFLHSVFKKQLRVCNVIVDRNFRFLGFSKSQVAVNEFIFNQMIRYFLKLALGKNKMRWHVSWVLIPHKAVQVTMTMVSCSLIFDDIVMYAVRH